MMMTITLPPDLVTFTERLHGPLRAWFEAGIPLTVARAPGRLDAIGGVIDYTGGMVCEMPLAVAVRAALQPRSDRRLRIVSTGVETHGLRPEVWIELDQLVPPSGPREYAAVCHDLHQDERAAWAGYVAGAWLVLAREGYVDGFAHGATVVIDSDVPVGAGVSSSAAVEMATLYALRAALGLKITGLRLAHLGQMVENRVVGAPCGLMDQLTVALGRADSLLVIRCQPDEIVASRRVPAGLQLAAIHTGVKHSVGGRRYTDARVAAFMGHAVLLNHLRADGVVEFGDDPYEGYLARVRWHEFDELHRPFLPDTLLGATFLRRYGGTVDAATRVDPDVEYRVRAAVTHHVRDNAGTRAFLAHLDTWERTHRESDLVAAGQMMLASHAGYRDDLGLGAAETDLLVELIMARGPQRGLYGARATGGGCGGSVVILGDDRLPAQLDELAAEYAERSGETPAVLTGSSDGAEACGVHEVVL
jgi:L-arabinokinase